MPGGAALIIANGAELIPPSTIGNLPMVAGITPPTLVDSILEQNLDGAVSFIQVGAVGPAAAGATETFRTKGGIISEGTGTDSVRIGRAAAAGGGVGRSIAIGTLASAANNENIAIGYNTSAGGTANSVAIGSGAAIVNAQGTVLGNAAYGQGNAGGAQVLALGQSANAQASNAGGQDSLAIGWLALARAYDTVIGMNAQSSVQSVFGNNNVVVGRNATSNVAQGANTVIGASSTTLAATTTIIGQGSSATAAGTRALIHGVATVAAHADVILIGNLASSWQANTAVIGGTNSVINTVVIGSGNTMAAPAAKLLRWTNATGADNAAGSVVFRAPLSTGVATEASFGIEVGTVQAAGATQHVPTMRLNFTPGGVAWDESVAPAGAAAVFQTGSRARHVFYGYNASGDSMSMRQVTTAQAPGYVAYRCNGTPAAPTAVASGDTLLNVGGGGYDANAWSVLTQGLFRVVASEAWTNVAHGTRLEMRVTKNATTAETTVVTVENDGSVTINPVGAATTALNFGANAAVGAAGAGVGTLNNLPAAVVAGNPAAFLIFNIGGVPTYFPGWQ